MSYTEAEKLPIDIFLRIYKKSVIDGLMQSQEGRDALKKASMQRCTECDVEALDRLFG
nr:hypothetical protein [uncultured Cellulosilyticum sp.]